MNTFKRQQGNTLFWIIGVIAIAVIAFFVFRGDRNTYNAPNGDELGASTERIILEGEVTCLPHRNTTGPVTLECAYGLKTDEGTYYGLDASALPVEKQGGYDTGERVSFEGVLLSAEEMPPNFWNTYNVVGLLKVEDYWVYRDK